MSSAAVLEPTRTGAGRHRALAVLCMGFLMVVLDGTIVSVALPQIRTDLQLSAAGTAWVVNAYLLPFGGLLLLAGRLGDLVGRRAVFTAGLVVFAVASLLCALAPSAELLLLARAAQGVGGALVSAVALGIVITLYPRPGERAWAIGVFSAVGAVGASVGLLLGGVLTQTAGWRAVFLVTVPFGVVAAVAAVRVVTRDVGAGIRAGADVPGAALGTAGLVLLVLAVVEAGARPVLGTIGLLVGAAMLLVAFTIRQGRAAVPVLPLRVLRSRTLVGANLVQLLMVAGALGFQFTGALHLQRVLGLNAAATGLGMTPIALAIGLLPLTATGRLVGRYGPLRVLVTGLAVLLAGYLLLVRVPADGQYLVDVLPAYVLFGIGGGLALPAVTVLAMRDAAAGDAGVASGLVNTGQQIGGALGIAVLTAAAAAVAGGDDVGRLALADGYQAAYQAGAGFVLLALLGAVAMAVQNRVAPGRSSSLG